MMLGPPAPTRRVVIVDMPDAVQTEIRVGHLGIRRDSADFTAADLAVRILGGDGANRLQQVLRTQRGLTYGASADLNAYRLTGDIVAGDRDTRPTRPVRPCASSSTSSSACSASRWGAVNSTGRRRFSRAASRWASRHRTISPPRC